MKTRKIFGGAMLMPVAFVLSVFTMSSCHDDDDPTVLPNYTISGDAAGSQVVPAAAGTGTGTITGTYNPNTRQLDYNSTYTGLSGAPTGGGLYYGASGVSGTSVGTPWTFGSTATGTGNYTGTMTLTEEQGTQLTSGNWYYGYNTTANTGGEVRGQITATR